MTIKNKSLFDDYLKYERIIKQYDNSKQMDITNEEFIAPTTLIPLIRYLWKNNIDDIKLNEKTFPYVSKIIHRKPTPTNTPFRVLPKTRKLINGESLSAEISMKINEEYAGHQTINHIVNELTNNIYDHTPLKENLASYGYCYAQEYPKWKKVDICVYDDGLSIPGKLQKSNVPFKDDCQAIEKVISGFTTVADRDRGNGLGTCLKMMNDNNGSALIVSRNGALEIDTKRNKYKYHHLNNTNIFKGTLITIKLRNKPVNFYETLGTGCIETTPYTYEGDKTCKIR